MEEARSRVYIIADDEGRVIQIEGEYSLENISDLSSAILVEEGAPCDRLNHAQNAYLDKPLRTEDGLYRYRWDGERITERSEDALETDRRQRPLPAPTELEQMRADLDFLLMLQEV